MSFSSWLRSWKSALAFAPLREARRQPAGKRRPRCLVGLEPLEGRVVPATFQLLQGTLEADTFALVQPSTVQPSTVPPVSQSDSQSLPIVNGSNHIVSQSAAFVDALSFVDPLFPTVIYGGVSAGASASLNVG